MSSHYEAPIRKPLVTGNKSYHDVSVDIAAPVEGSANKQWWIVGLERGSNRISGIRTCLER